MKEYTLGGHKFLELAVEDYPNITVTSNGLQVVLVRDNSDATIVNTIQMPGKPVVAKVNNREVA